jgi:hypothetical protein
MVAGASEGIGAAFPTIWLLPDGSGAYCQAQEPLDRWLNY